jgi:hypothetical protein
MDFMTKRDLTLYLSGLITMGYLACGLFFAKFWWRTRDFLFWAFAGAFWLLAANAAVLTMLPPENEHRVWAYLLRVPAYLLIVAAIIRKNAGRANEE